MLSRSEFLHGDVSPIFDGYNGTLDVTGASRTEGRVLRAQSHCASGEFGDQNKPLSSFMRIRAKAKEKKRCGLEWCFFCCNVW